MIWYRFVCDQKWLIAMCERCTGLRKLVFPRSCQRESQGVGLLEGTLWLFNIAMQKGPFIDGLPIKNGDFPWLR
jgi:hypothetical protein